MKMLSSLICVLAFALSAQAGKDAAHGEGHGEGKAHRDNGALFPQPKADLNKGTPPKSPVLAQPALEAKVDGDAVTLKWNASEGATDYHVQVATDSTFKWLKADEHWVKGTSFEVKGLEKGKMYFWRVAAWKNDNMAATNKSMFSASSFETK